MSELQLSHTKAECWEFCPRKYYLRYEKGIDSPKGEKMLFGSLLHAGLSKWFVGEPEEAAIAAIYEEADRLAQGDDFERAKAQPLANEAAAMLRRYAQTPEAAHFTPHTTETKFCVPLDDGVDWIGVFDILGRERGSLAIGENKTTSSFPTDSYGWDRYKAKWRRSPQLIGYAFAAAKMLGERVQAGVVNLFRRVNEYRCCPACRNGCRKKVNCQVCCGEGRIKNGENPFAQVRTTINEWKIQIFLESRRRIAQEILRAKETGEYPMRLKSCDFCDPTYIEICWQADPNAWRNVDNGNDTRRA